MLKRLLVLMGEAEAACWRAIGLDISSPGVCEKPTREDYERAIDNPGHMDFGVVYTYAVFEGISEESAFALGSAYAAKIAEGMSKAYSLFYAAAYCIACSLIGASEQWARAYAGACAHAIAVRESRWFAAVYGHAVADGASPEDARAFARRYAV
ncbi:MAG: hypothetical protein OXL97_07745 [Chloroflexota bacterium]|nr:hypothetical protein [Chloroflexota bacterium]MDE2885962.1 hypothetical protein [Chloroflexota bacterium]